MSNEHSILLGRIAGSPDRRIAGSPDRRIAQPASAAWGRSRPLASPPESSSAAGRRSGPDTPDNPDPAFAHGRRLRGVRGTPVRPPAAALLCLLLLAGLTTEALAQTRVLVSNIGQTDHDWLSLSYDLAQAFTTGANSAGYTLSSVDVRFVNIADSALASKLTVTIRSNSAGSPDTVVGTLTNPAISISTLAQTVSFTHPGLDLAANTTYWLMIDLTAAPTGTSYIQQPSSNAEDASSLTDWSIANAIRYRNQDDTGVWTTAQSVIAKLRINGAVKTAPPVVSIAADSTAVTEGSPARFTLTANPPPANNIAVYVQVSQSGRVVAERDIGVHALTIGTSGTAQP